MSSSIVDGIAYRSSDPVAARQPLVHCYHDIQELPASAKALLEEEDERRFFNGLSWYRVFCYTCLDQGQHPTFYVAASRENQEQQLILPLLTPLGRAGSVISGSQLGPQTCMSMTNYQSAHFGPVTNTAGSDCAELLDGLATHLKAQRFSILDFNHLDPAIPANAALQASFTRAGFKTYGYPDEPIVFEDIAGRSYADFMGDRSAKLRRNIRRLRAKLEKIGQVRFELIKGGQGLEDGIRDYEAVQKASWKKDEVYTDHVPALIRAAADAGTLRLGLLYLDDRPVATDLSMLSDGHVTGKKGHFDNEMRQHHVGDVLTSYMLEHLIDIDKVRSVDFGKTAASYKLKWVKQQRPLNGFVAFHPATAQGQLSRFLFRSKQIARSRLSALKRKLPVKS